jgi:hypothetical protein
MRLRLVSDAKTAAEFTIGLFIKHHVAMHTPNARSICLVDYVQLTKENEQIFEIVGNIYWITDLSRALSHTYTTVAGFTGS